MPLFKTVDNRLSLLKPSNFKMEKDLQKLMEANLATVFNCKFVATEFSTGAEHAGRIDTLALSEDLNPVIIEYKKVESSELINQSLFYLSWLRDHKGDFELACRRLIGEKDEIDWSEIRVICIAPGYKKYDLHAVRVMGANIELWQYRMFEDNSIYLEEIFKKTTTLLSSEEIGSKNPVMVAAGKKAAITRATATYSFDEHILNVEPEIKNIVADLRDFILSLDEAIVESPKKFYVAYKVLQNFVCIEVQKKKILLYLKVDPKAFKVLPKNTRDVTNIGHFGTGDFEFTLRSKEDLEVAQRLIKDSFEATGG